MIKLSHYYSLTSEWQHETACNMGTKIIKDKILILPENIGNGLSYFMPVAHGISVVMLDAVFTNEVIINRLKSDNDLYILQFDLSNEINPVTIKDIKNYSQDTEFTSGFSVMHTSIENSFIPIVDQRIFSLRILVDKQILLGYLSQIDPEIKNKNIEKRILFYNHVNAGSKVMINSLKEKSVFDLDFDFYLKGIALKLFANFLDMCTNPCREEISKIDIAAINITKEYLLENLYSNFPSVVFLAKMAGMSVTKFKVTFKKLYHITPNQYFIQQKMDLSYKLLQSGAFNNVHEMLQVLNYSQYNYFASRYYKYFKRKPCDDLKKKKICD